MPLAFHPDETNPLVAALLSDLGIAPGTVDLAIDARDEMLGFLVGDVFEGDRDRALFDYFRSGASIADSLGQVLRWRFGSLERVGKILDFASGYGRVTRFLARDVPPERVWVADIYADGVRFQEERLGVHGIVSAIRPEDFACAERFDAILVTSLFTHLPAERFVAWLRVLLGLLAPGGVLAFSAHSPEMLPEGVAMPESGICFQETSESGSLATSDYGSTWVTDGFVRSALDRALGPGASLRRIERGLCNFQDLYLALPEPGVGFATLDFQWEPLLFLERAKLAEGGRRLDLGGWAIVRSGAVREVEALLGDERLAVTTELEPRQDVAAALGAEPSLRCGWSLACPLPAGAWRSSALLRLRVMDGRGRVHPLWAGAIESALLAGVRQHADKLRLELWRTRDRLEEERARAADATAEAEALRLRVQGMEASRFWKIRNAWFAVKRGMGRTDER
jgi:SAM-dependent methyltransferase